uniref:Uncharacterized protein n=1 Tax=Lygus hesperus TaxID=30085 RepID=A0A0A9XZM4_LYGHE
MDGYPSTSHNRSADFPRHPKKQTVDLNSLVFPNQGFMEHNRIKKYNNNLREESKFSSKNNVPVNVAKEVNDPPRDPKQFRRTKKEILNEVICLDETNHCHLEEPICIICKVVTENYDTMVNHSTSSDAHLKGLSECLAEMIGNEESDDSDYSDEAVPKRPKLHWNLVEEVADEQGTIFRRMSRR